MKNLKTSPTIQFNGKPASRNTTSFRGISGSTLKIIAIVTMLLDHIGASLLQPILTDAARSLGVTSWSAGNLISACPDIAIPYYILCYIGRIAFPIFCFLLVEGFLHTRNLQKYCLRLAIFALISEIPFDLAFHYTPFYPKSQNVFFTLLIGLLVISFDRWCHESLTAYPFSNILPILVFLAGMALAEYLQTDYGCIGIIAIDVLYQLRRHRITSCILAAAFLCLSSSLEVTAFLFVPLVGFYNEERGLSLKYVFYLFYPVHLFILYLIGIAGAR